ncbi:MAG: DUF6817 domain-containing protein [Cyanobacteria bacterium P01_A01_bin.40]
MNKLELAQNNVQLLNQLRKHHYSLDELHFIFDSYQYCIELCAGFQSSGKPFIAHLVRTASILVELKQETSVIVSGLLHSVYEFGDFGDGSRKVTSWKRELVKKKVGKTVENYIYQYACLQWNDENIIAVYSGFDQLNPVEKNVLLIRLSNELEQSIDLEPLYRDDYELKIKQIQSRKDILVDMANRLGYSTLANQLNQALSNILLLAEEITNLKLRNSMFFGSISGSLSLKFLLSKRLKAAVRKINLIK